MFSKLKEFFFGKPKESAPEAPYKVEAPVAEKAEAKKCGCGRSQNGLCVGLHSLTQEQWATHADNPAKPKKTRAKKAPAAITAAAPKKPRAKKTTT